jgi:hypothetical protein
MLKIKTRVEREDRAMPAVWERTVKVTQTLVKRRGQAFCDGCGMLIKDDHYYKWSVNPFVSPHNIEFRQMSASHISPFCCGLVLMALLADFEHTPEQ